MKVRLQHHFLCALFFLTSAALFSQTPRFNSQLDGHWTGAFIKDNSIQIFEVDFFVEDDSLRSSMSIPDWVYYEPVVRPVKVDSGRYAIASYYGWMSTVLDSAYAEMIGTCSDLNVHMKKALRNAKVEVETITMNFDVGDITLEGKLIRPKGQGPLPTAIMVHGRGCSGYDTWQARPRVLAQYGMAVLTFDKRGYKRNGYDCETTDLNMHATDLAKISAQLAKRKDVEKLGYIGYSAGGWVAPMATNLSEVPIDFMITVVGPSTSIRQQQLDCSEYYLRGSLGLGEKEISKAKLLVELECSDAPASELFPKIEALIAESKKNGWFDVLEESDIPKSVEEFDKLWLRRNQYDPAEDLKSFKGPFLSILGGGDDVAPWKPNSERFFELFEEAGKKNFEVVVLPAASHGLEHGEFERTFEVGEGNGSVTYLKFDRVAPGAIDEIVRFLREMEIIDR